MSKIKILTIFGTRPEAIKMAPVVKKLKEDSFFEAKVCSTSQHRQMLDQVLDLFKITPDYDLDIMKENQDLWSLTANVLQKTKTVLDEFKPDVVLVHGDTTTSMAAALSAFYSKIPVGHVEAGLRTFEKYYPFPEEINRVFVDALCEYHFAPTEDSVNNLIKCGISQKYIFKTGNTVIDALFDTVKNNKVDLSYLNLDKKLRTIVVTAHRRENFGEPIKNICKAILELAEKNKDIQIVYPVHLNPNVREVVMDLLANKDRIHLIEPLEYAPFASLMQEAYMIMSDSGGVQEEAPSLGKPVLVLRDTTERPDAVKYGTVKLVGTDFYRIVNTAQELLDNKNEYDKMAKATNPYGDGFASDRIVKALKEIFCQN